MASVREAEPDITPARLRQALFLRFYGHEYDDDARERILARLATETGMVLRRRVPINWDDLEIALTWRSDDIKPFLDLRTGTIRHYALSAFGIDAEELGLTEDEADQGRQRAIWCGSNRSSRPWSTAGRRSSSVASPTRVCANT